MSDHVVIRAVTIQDLDACYTVESRCFLPSEAASRAKIEKRIRLYPQGFLVAEVAGDVVGHINSGATHKDDISDEALKDMVGHDAEGANRVVFSLAVLPEHQKRGIARQLMHHFIEQSRRLGKKQVLLLCKTHLIAYYERIGFVYAGESASTHGGFAWHEMALALDT